MSKHAKRVRKIVLAASFLCAMAAAGTILGAEDRNVPPTPSRSSAPELLLVRAWNPQTGELIGWMPLHRVAITLQGIGAGAPSFDLNDAVAVDFPYRPGASPQYGGVHVAPGTATFQGRKWLPAELTPNIVRIHGFPFYVRSIEFGESRWRASAVVTPASQKQPK